MTLADTLSFMKEDQLVEEVLLHLGVSERDSRVGSIVRGVRAISHQAQHASGNNKYLIVGYKGYQDNLPSCFVDIVSKNSLETFKEIPAWENVLIEWLPGESIKEKVDVQCCSFSKCIDLITESAKLDVMPTPIRRSMFPMILAAEICPSVDSYITHSTPALIIGRLLTYAGFAYPDYGLECDLLHTKWDIRALGMKSESLRRLVNHSSFAYKQMEIRDDLFTYISYYQALWHYLENIVENGKGW